MNNPPYSITKKALYLKKAFLTIAFAKNGGKMVSGEIWRLHSYTKFNAHL
jgi:hypothetical protein